MLKKAVVLSMSLFLTASFGTSTFAAETNSNYDKVIASIEQTNTAIEDKIARAVKDSDALESQYISDVQKIEEGDTVVKLKDQKKKLEDELGKTTDAAKIDKLTSDLAQLNDKLDAETARINDKIAAIKDDIDQLNLLNPDNEKDQAKVDAKIAKLNEKLDQRLQKYNDRTEKFTNDLDKLINDLYNSTLKMSNDAIKKAADQGVEAEAYWTLVELGGKLVWIDPIRVVWR